MFTHRLTPAMCMFKLRVKLCVILHREQMNTNNIISIFNSQLHSREGAQRASQSPQLQRTSLADSLYPSTSFSTTLSLLIHLISLPLFSAMNKLFPVLGALASATLFFVAAVLVVFNSPQTTIVSSLISRSSWLESGLSHGSPAPLSELNRSQIRQSPENSTEVSDADGATRGCPEMPFDLGQWSLFERPFLPDCDWLFAYPFTCIENYACDVYTLTTHMFLYRYKHIHT